MAIVYKSIRPAPTGRVARPQTYSKGRRKP